MKLSWTRAIQWVGILAVLVFVVALRYEAPSEAGMQMNASPDSPFSQSLRGYWKLDDGTGTNATDSSGNGNTLAMTGSPSWVTGQIGPSALDFSGSGQYLSIASPSSALDFTDGASFTLTGWFNRDTFANDHTILSTKSGQSTESDGYIAYIDDATDQLIIRFDENGSTDARTFTSTSTFTATGWHSFALSWNESAPDAVLYIDGKPDGSGSGTVFASMGDLSNSNAFYIGAETDAGNPFDGKLDDIRIYGYALSAEQVKKLYNTTAPTQPVDTSLVGHWTFDGTDIQGTTAIDRSSFGNNGTITGATKTIGKLGQALSFNGTSDYVDVGTALDCSGTKTVSLWFKELGNEDTLFFSSTGGTSDYILIEFYNSDRIAVEVEDTYPSSKSRQVSGFNTDEWYHLVVTKTAGGVTGIYVNGFDEAGSGGNFSPFGGTNKTYIGRHPSGGYFEGSIDDVRIYNRTLSTTEITNLYNLGK
ncbi:MAG: LamG domain-containing protein [Candidatus Moraniibacteriota bacterium]|nr:MAG: LamG domain-containing protein [Candidatus Moranbacteria bacterium]